jgi:hypothetical protein
MSMCHTVLMVAIVIALLADLYLRYGKELKVDDVKQAQNLRSLGLVVAAGCLGYQAYESSAATKYYYF